MRKTSVLSVLSMLLVVGVTLAANAHFIGSPTVTQNNNRSLTICGTIAGLGNEDVTIVVSAKATTTCTNNGGKVPPGLTETLSGSISNLRPENGKVKFCASTNAAGDPCPGPMKPLTSFSDVTVKVYQGGKLVLSQTF